MPFPVGFPGFEDMRSGYGVPIIVRLSLCHQYLLTTNIVSFPTLWSKVQKYVELDITKDRFSSLRYRHLLKAKKIL